ncbi:MAG: hypothetical protein K0S63_1295, partial [Gammaproteobacteria bacterium]|nr:hypothetical protein [Gammaproteobacteria bacterium]
MTLSKKLTIALMCTCLIHSFGIGMEKSEVEYRISKVTQPTPLTNPLYMQAMTHLGYYIKYPDDNIAHVQAAVEALTKASNDGHLDSENLLHFVRPFLKAALDKSEQTHQSIAGLCAIHFATGCYEQGYNMFLTLCKYNIQDLRTFTDVIMVNKSTMRYVFKKFKYLNQDKIRSQNDITQITQCFLDQFIFTNINRYSYRQMGADIQSDIGKVFIDASLCTSESNSHKISVPKMDGTNVNSIERKKAYYSQGMKYSILAAKQGEQEAYGTLIQALKEMPDYQTYYSILFPYLKDGDKQAQDLFNKVAIQDYQAFLHFDLYGAMVLANEKYPDKLSGVIERVMRNYDLFKNNQKQDDRCLNLPSTPLKNVGKSPIQIIANDADLKKEPQLFETAS